LPAEAAPSFLWVPELAVEPGAVELSLEESHYLARVCRARPGDQVFATDGRGRLAELRILSLGRRARAEVERIERSDRRRRAWVWCGAPEGRRADWLVEKLAELGIEAWQPLECERARWRNSQGVIERWRRLAVAALRQSRRRFLMEIRPPVTLEEAAGTIPEGSLRWLADAAGGRGGAPPAGAACAIGVVGPAAGFSAGERDRLAALGFQAMCLADGRLRSETAALAWAAWWALGEA